MFWEAKSPEPPEAQALGLHVYRGFYLHVTLPSEPSYFKTKVNHCSSPE